MPDADGGGASGAAAAFEEALAKEEAEKAAAEAAEQGPIGSLEDAPPGSPVEEEAEGGEKTGDGKVKKEKKAKKEKGKDDRMGNIKHPELDWIWIGACEDARDRDALKANNIRYILNCTPVRANGGVSNFHDKEPCFDYCRVAMGDNATETLRSRIECSWDFLEKARIREDGGVLIHCQQGVSRSVSMAMAYMMKYYRKSFDEALALSKECRKQANPNEGFMKQLRELDDELRTKNLYEPIPPPRKKLGDAVASRGPGVSGPPRGPGVGPARGPAGPAGPARGPVGPSGPARGPVGPSGPSAGPSVGPARGPSGPAVGPAGPPGPEKRKAGPSAGPSAGPTVGPAMPPKKAKVGPAVGPARP